MPIFNTIQELGTGLEAISEVKIKDGGLGLESRHGIQDSSLVLELRSGVQAGVQALSSGLESCLELMPEIQEGPEVQALSPSLEFCL